MLHKDKRSINTKASPFWTIKALAAVMLLVMLALPAAAHPPAQVSLAYDSQNQTLKVTTTHTVSNPTSHYVFKIDVLKNGVQVLTKEYTSQPTSSTFSYDYPINATKGDVLKATAYCSIAGSRSAEITVVEDAKLAVPQVGAENATEGNASLPLDKIKLPPGFKIDIYAGEPDLRPIVGLGAVRVAEAERIGCCHHSRSHAVHVADNFTDARRCTFVGQDLAGVVVALMGYDDAPVVIDGNYSGVLDRAHDHIGAVGGKEFFQCGAGSSCRSSAPTTWHHSSITR